MLKRIFLCLLTLLCFSTSIMADKQQATTPSQQPDLIQTLVAPLMAPAQTDSTNTKASSQQPAPQHSATTTPPQNTQSMSQPAQKPNPGNTSKGRLPDASAIPGSTENIMKRLDNHEQRLQSFEQRLQRIEKQLSDLNNNIAGLQKKSKQLVCSADGKTSINETTKARDNCKAYQCNPVSGLCRTSCSSSEHCARGTHVCQLETGVCIAAG